MTDSNSFSCRFSAGRPIPIAGERQTVEQYLTRWLESIRTNVRPRTLERFEQIVRLHLIPNIGRHRIEKLQPGHVQALLNQNLGSLSLQSVKHIRTTLGIALNQAVKWEVLARNVVALTKLRPVETEEVKPLSADDARKLLNCATGHRLEALYSVAIAVGLRRGEALGLSWDDIDLDKETLRVNRSLQRVREGGKGELRLLPPKTQKSRRTIRLPKFAIKALRKHRARQAEERLLAGVELTDNNLVFTTRTGRLLEPRNVVRHFKSLLTRAKLAPSRFHDLRHTAASLLLVQSVHPRVVMEILGHARITMTMDTYSHVMPLAMTDAAAKMDAILAR